MIFFQYGEMRKPSTSCNSMRATRAGLDRNLNKENINFSAIINAHMVEIAREGKISSTKHKPDMIPREMSKFSTKRSSLSYSRAKSSILSDCGDFVAGFIQCQVNKESALMEIQQKQPVASYSTAGSASISSQVVFGW